LTFDGTIVRVPSEATLIHRRFRFEALQHAAGRHAPRRRDARVDENELEIADLGQAGRRAADDAVGPATPQDDAPRSGAACSSATPANAMRTAVTDLHLTAHLPRQRRPSEKA
jgi:hypothetical protein